MPYDVRWQCGAGDVCAYVVSSTSRRDSNHLHSERTASTMSDKPSAPKNPLKEIVQPFIDLIHAPRALWGINLAYVLEGMVYFGMLGYLAIYCSDYLFQAVDGADEAAHQMVMVLTAGITIAMFFLGVVADKRGVRFALIAAFCLMLLGRGIWAGAPTIFGLDPKRPQVVVGDLVDLHIKELGTIKGNKAITSAEIVSLSKDDKDAVERFKFDLSAGEGVPLTAELESRVVSISDAEVLEGEGQEWTIRYGQSGQTAKLLIRGAEVVHLKPGARISLDQAYIGQHKEEKGEDTEQVLREGTRLSLTDVEVVENKEGEYELRVQWPGDVLGVDVSSSSETDAEYFVHSHWVSDIRAVDTFSTDIAVGLGLPLLENLPAGAVRLGEATLVDGAGSEWTIRYGDGSRLVRVVFEGSRIGLVDADWLPDLSAWGGLKLGESYPRFDRPSFDSDKQDGQESDASKKMEANETVDLTRGQVCLSEGVLIGREGDRWKIEYGADKLVVLLDIRSSDPVTLDVGARIGLARASIERLNDKFFLKAYWPSDFNAIDTYGCDESPYQNVVTADERNIRVLSSELIKGNAPDGPPFSIGELRQMEDGPVDRYLLGMRVTYVRSGGYFVQGTEEGPAIFVFVSPFWSNLQWITLLGMFLVVVGYGMYQPAAYAGVRKFTTPKTAAMGFAMLYALMNLGGWLPSFAFLLRDDDYVGLGIRGMFWIYTGFTLLALVVTVLILNRKTVEDADTKAKEETGRIKADEAKQKESIPEEGESQETLVADSTNPADSPKDQNDGIRPHIVLLWLAAAGLFLFKSESPWYHSWEDTLWRWVIAGLILISPVFILSIPRTRNWLRKHPLQDAKFSYFIFALIPVQTLFTYNWLVLPAYINRAFEGWIGEYFEIAANANPILIFIAVPLIAAATQKRKVYNMMIVGTLIMAAPAFLLVVGPFWWTLAGYIFIMTVGEAMWQPRFLQYAAEIAPEGRTGEYMGVAQLPWFLTKVLVPLLYSGAMMDKFCPAEGPQNTEVMWFIFACIAMVSPILLLLAYNWIGRDFKTAAD